MKDYKKIWINLLFLQLKRGFSIYMLIPTQEKIRNISNILSFAREYIAHGYHALPKPKYLHLDSTNDHYIYDGHTRVVAHYLVFGSFPKGNVIAVDETYTTTPNFEQGFVTPFDLEREVRHADFYAIKQFILSNKDVPGIIEHCAKLYKKPRKLQDAYALCEQYEFLRNIF